MTQKVWVVILNPDEDPQPDRVFESLRTVVEYVDNLDESDTVSITQRPVEQSYD